MGKIFLLNLLFDFSDKDSILKKAKQFFSIFWPAPPLWAYPRGPKIKFGSNKKITPRDSPEDNLKTKK